MNESDFLRARAAMYELLARLHTYPLDGAALNAVTALSLDNAPTALSDALAVMQARIAAAPDRDAFVEALNVQATRLFEGPGQPAAPPFASFYLNGGKLMGAAALAARRAYLARNVRPNADGRIPPDHLALELGFMAFLAREDAGRGLADSAVFLREHLLTWVPRWSAAVVAASAHPFFVGLANLTRAMLESDARWLEILEFSHSNTTEVIR
ncbi:MAG: molecular chaperone TorD family protein [Chloroflexi bacterium]|nr:molecular chaperone TorD family protein [Chloroflexota bacterium]